MLIKPLLKPLLDLPVLVNCRPMFNLHLKILERIVVKQLGDLLQKDDY